MTILRSVALCLVAFTISTSSSFAVTYTSDNFRMLIPVYLELADGHIANIGRARLVGNNSVEEKVPLKGLKDTPRRALINYYDDVLSTTN